jgi:hypothetical protein
MLHILFWIDQPTHAFAPQHLISYIMTRASLLTTGTTNKHENTPVRNTLIFYIVTAKVWICGLVAKDKSRRVIAPIKLTLRRVPLTDKSITAGIVMHIICYRRCRLRPKILRKIPTKKSFAKNDIINYLN